MHALLFFFLFFPSHADYSATTQTLTFPSSENELFISIPIIDDSIVENDETFSAMLSLSTPAASVAIQQSTAEVTIINDDSMNQYIFIQ